MKTPTSAGLLVLALLTVLSAQQAAPSGEEVYVDRLGCWNCHGKAGAGGAGRMIAKTRLPLRRFASYVRLPSGEMPPYSSMLASDAELAIVYRWLDGVDAVKAPLPITITLTGAPGVLADGQAKAETEIALTAQSDGAQLPSVRYRITVLTQANAPLANLPFEGQRGGGDEWSKVTTDQNGEAPLSATAQAPPARLRIALGAGKYALVVEAIDEAAPASPVVVGIGTAIVKVG